MRRFPKRSNTSSKRHNSKPMAHSNANIHLTEDVIADFAGTGSQRLIEKLHVKDVPKDTMSEIFIEILICLEDGLLTSNAIADFLQQAINDEEKAIIFVRLWMSFLLLSQWKLLWENLTRGKPS